MASLPNAGETQWNRVSGTLEAHWPDGTVTQAMLQEQNVQQSMQAFSTMGGGQFFVSPGSTMATFYLKRDQVRPLLAPILSIGASDAVVDGALYLEGVTLYRPDDPDWHGISPYARYASKGGGLMITCVWQLTPEAQARQVQAEAQRWAQAEAQAKALTAETPAQSLRWAAFRWWYDEWDDGEAVHVECPVCHAFSPSIKQEVGLSQLYALDQLPCRTRCTTCNQTVWLTRDLLRETAEFAVERGDQ